MKPVSVSQLNSYIKRILASDPILNNITVIGEVSNLTKHSSGHWYFSLKDESSRVSCFMPYSAVLGLKYEISEGMQVTVTGSINLFEKNGQYNINIRSMMVEGEGSLKLAFDNLKLKLEKEGLFAEDHKKSIPCEPKRIGVITSPTGAAVRDIITTIRRRNSNVDILIYPALVQGDNSAASICDGIVTFNKLFPNLDLLIIGRGGGSIEDLWSFNEESVARAVYASDIPIISAVGHEIDIVITDFVADLRAATPTAAAELAVPLKENQKDRLSRVSPENLYFLLENKLNEAENRLNMLKIAIDANDPQIILDKGFVLAEKNKSAISSVNDISVSDEIYIRFKDGLAKVVVSEVRNG